MKDVLRSIAMAFCMFSVIPMPRVEWKKENMRFMLCALPLVGVVIAAALWLWAGLCGLLAFGTVFTAGGLALLPVLLSGAIHMDGFADTRDALASHAPMEKKREILKDSHTGAFAVIGVGVFLVARFAVCTELTDRSGVMLLGLVSILARVTGGFAGTAFSGSGQNGTLAAFHSGADRCAPAILATFGLLCGAALVLVSPAGGTAAFLTAVAVTFCVRGTAKKQFGGMSGDLAGYLITLNELLPLIAYLLAERMFAL